MIIDRSTPATQNGLENVIRSWPRWMFCKAFKKHKLCSSWRVQKDYLVGNSFADFCTCFSLVITPRDRHNMPVSILFVCTATHVPWRRVQKAYLVGIAKSFADFCTCFSPVITPHNMSVSILFVCTATHVPWCTGRTKVALVELPTVNMFGFFFFTLFPRRILAWSFVVPRSHFHPPKALKSYMFKRGW